MSGPARSVADGYGSPASQRTVVTHAHHRPAAEQGGGLKLGRPVVALQVVHQAEVEAAVQDRPLDLGLLCADHLDLGRVVDLPEQPDRRGQQRHRGGVHRAHPHLADALPLLAGALPEPVDRVEDGEDVRQQVAARVAHPRPVAAALQQVHAQFPFQAAYRPAQRRLGDVQCLGRTAERPQPGHLGQVLQLLNAHGGRIRSLGRSTKL